MILRRISAWAACCALLCITLDVHSHRDRGSWKKPLHEKAELFERHIEQRHNIEGSYPSSVRLIPPKHYAGSQEGAWEKIAESGELPDGWIFDHGTTGLSNIAHTSSWTGSYLTGEAFRVAFLRENHGTDSPEYKKAYARADEVIGSLRILTLVSGVPGYLARGVAYGHGISYEERDGANTRDLWAQGVGKYSYLRYRGGPSHHNYDQVFRGLGTYYFVAADDRQKEAIRAIVDDMSNWAHLKHDMVVRHTDGKRESTVLIGGWRGLDGDDRPSGGSLMATTGLKIAYEITKNPKLKKLYDKWVDRLGYRDPEMTQESIMGSPRGNYDDTDHLLGDLYVLLLIEKAPELLAFYRKCVRDSWEAHKDDKMAWFNYVYGVVLGEDHSDHEGSLWNLQTFPVCRVFQPQMNSIRTDIEFQTHRGRRESLHPLPVYERPFDNEYTWKGSPYRLDAWTSRIGSVLEVSPHDPYVQVAADTGGVSYLSNTRGEIWHGMPGLPRVNDFLFSTRYPWMLFAATEGGIYRSLNGGESWGRVLGDRAYRLHLDPENDHILYAVTHGQIYKSADLGERAMGTQWHSIGGPEPASAGRLLDVDPNGPKAKLYMLTREGLYTKTEGDTEWNSPPRAERMRGFSDVDPIGGKPAGLRVVTGKKKRIFRTVTFSGRSSTNYFPSFSEDEGKTWTPVVRQLKPVADWDTGTAKTVSITEEELRDAFALLSEFSIQDIWVDRDRPDTWYGRLEAGIAVTHDAGKTWTVSKEGLDIPLTRAMWIPRHSSDVYVGTPAGVYVSRDRGASWQDTTLILQGSGAIRSEVNGNGYCIAYWMGRYHGFITEEEAQAEWWKE